MTAQGNYTLRFDLWDVDDKFYQVDYADFKVGDEESLYRLEVGQYSGNLSDSLENHNHMQFSTHDADHDASSTHCALYYRGGWWYSHCQYVNVNGQYHTGLTWYNHHEKQWVQLKKIQMKLGHQAPHHPLPNSTEDLLEDIEEGSSDMSDNENNTTEDYELP